MKQQNLLQTDRKLYILDGISGLPAIVGINGISIKADVAIMTAITR